MGFELAFGRSTGDLTPFAICDNLDCDHPVLRPDGWVITGIEDIDGIACPRGLFLACSDACLARIKREKPVDTIGWGEPMRFGDYWHAIANVTADPNEEPDARGLRTIDYIRLARLKGRQKGEWAG